MAYRAGVLFVMLYMASMGQCIVVCPKCLHLELITVFPKVSFWDMAFAKQNDSTCKELDTLYVFKEICKDSELAEDKEFRCGYTHGEITGVAPGVEGFKVNVTERKCLMVTKSNKNGCYDEDSSDLAENWVKFIPKPRALSFKVERAPVRDTCVMLNHANVIITTSPILVN